MFFKTNSVWSFYRSMLVVILACLVISSNPQQYKVISLRNSNSTMAIVLKNFTDRNWPTFQTNFPSNLTSGTTNGTKKTSESYFFKSKEYRQIVIAVMSVTATGTLLNLLVIVAMVIDPLKILRKGPWVSILNLAIADLISCISCFFQWGKIFFIYKPKEDCIIYFGWSFGSSASFLWLTFLSFQIFVITKFPVKSRYWFTNVKIVMIGTAIWLFAFPMGLSEITYSECLPVPYMTGLKIWTSRIGVLEIAVVIQIVLNMQVTFEIIRSGRSSGNPQNAKHKNIAMTVIILTLILFVTAFPYFLLKQLEFLARLRYFDHHKTAQVLEQLSYRYAPIAMLNFVANPILYALRLPNYRQTLLAFVGKSNSSRRSFTQNRSPHLTSSFALERQKDKAVNYNMSEKVKDKNIKELPVSSED